MKYLSLIIITLTLASCQNKTDKKEEPKEEMSLEEKANDLAQKIIVLDGHVDLPYRLKAVNFNIDTDKETILKTDKGDFDYERAVKGGLNAPFMSIYIPASYQKSGGAKELADTLINMVESIATAYPDKFAIAKTAEDVEKQFAEGKISLPMGMENGAPIGNDLKNVAHFNDRGISYITLTHSKNNQICDSSYDPERKWNGLSPFGVEVVKEMNQVGIMVDIAHVSDSTFYQVMELSEAPVIASHSSCRHFTPDFERNMSDDMIKLLGEKGGVIQINFGVTFLDGNSREVWDHVEPYYEAHEKDPSDTASFNYMEKYKAENNFYVSVTKVADHIDHVVKIAGIDHVGLGSDFDGVGDTLPEGLKDVSTYPNLILELLKRGYTEEDIEKICYKNVFRVWKKVDELAQKTK